MKLLGVVFLSLCFLSGGSLLRKINNAPKEPLVCVDGELVPWTIDCSTDYQIEFTSAKKNLFSNQVTLKGLITLEPHTIRGQNETTSFEDVKIIHGVSKLDSDICHVISETHSDQNGEFKIVVNLQQAHFLQFSYVGFSTYLIKLKN